MEELKEILKKMESEGRVRVTYGGYTDSIYVTPIKTWKYRNGRLVASHKSFFIRHNGADAGYGVRDGFRYRDGKVHFMAEYEWKSGYRHLRTKSITWALKNIAVID